MKKQTCYIIFIFTIIILLCLCFGKRIIHEGNESNIVSTSTPADIPGAKDRLTKTGGLKDDVIIDKDAAKREAEIAELAKQAAMSISGRKEGEISDLKTKILKALRDIIDSAYTPPVLFLPLINNAKNYAKHLEIKDPTNQTVDTNKNISGGITNLEYIIKDNKSCVFFKNEFDNYLSFPVNVSLYFSFCFWIYVDLTDQTPHYTVVSLTNKTYMNPSIQVDIINHHIVIVSALPTHWSMYHIYRVQQSGWIHIAYTFKCNDDKNNAEVNVYLNKEKFTNIYIPPYPKRLRPWEKRPPFRFFQNDPDNRKLVLYTPDTFIIGRSGDTQRAYKGYIRRFLYYAMELSPKQIENIYRFTEND